MKLNKIKNDFRCASQVWLYMDAQIHPQINGRVEALLKYLLKDKVWNQSITQVYFRIKDRINELK
jgi:hypothetical protein